MFNSTTAARLQVGHLWGEQALFVGEESVFTIEVLSDECKLLIVTREGLRGLLSQHHHLNAQVLDFVDELLHHEYYDPNSPVSLQETPLSPKILRRTVLRTNEEDHETYSDLAKQRREENAAYANSQQEKQRLLNIAVRAAISDSLFVSLPEAKKYLERAVDASFTAHTPPSRSRRPTSANIPHSRPSSAVTRPCSAQSGRRPGTNKGGKFASESTWSQWTGKRLHKHRHPAGPAMTALEMIIHSDNKSQ